MNTRLQGVADRDPRGRHPDSIPQPGYTQRPGSTQRPGYSQRPGKSGRPGPRRRLDANRTGAYLVEFALVTPLFFIVVLGSLEIARFMYFRQAIDQAAYEACRTGVVTGARLNQVRNTANSMLAAYGVTQANISISPAQIDEETETVTVSITANFADNSWVTPKYLPLSATTTTVTLDHENQAFLVPKGVTDSQTLTENEEPLDL